MRASVLAVFAAFVVGPALFGTYTYYYTDSLTSINTSNWTENGTLTAGSGGLTSSNTDGGSLISKVSVPDGSSNYEVKTVLTLTQSGGTYVTYLRASTNALSGPTAAGTAYVFEVQNPTFSGASCSATLGVYKLISNAVTSLASTTIPCNNGMTIRAIYTAIGGQIVAYVNNIAYFWTEDSSIASGQPGIGVRGAPTGNSIAEVQLGGIYVGNPVFPSDEIAVSAFANKVEIQWPGGSEGTSGPGVAFYEVFKNGTDIWNPYDGSFVDTTVSASTTYTYMVIAYDFDLNGTADTFTVNTPPTGAIDPRELGVRPTGSYWGGGGEQIDMLSGNLNYTTPILKAMGRGGWSVSFNLTYNSQNWRQDPAGTWQLGEDVGYGYGWKLLAGSLLPMNDVGGIGEYIFTDATGAEYHLNQNSSGIWTSRESIYVSYNANTNTVHFNDGSFWVMGCTSAGTEWDGGTMYPTLMEDSNGNQVIIGYKAGVGTTWSDSSSRISTIEDVRGNGTRDYAFTYNTDAIPHLTGITNYIGTSENYSFSYTEGYSLKDPFANASFGTVTLLQSSSAISVPTVPLTTYFTYDTTASTASCTSSGTGTSGAGQLTQVTTPYCGHIRWTYTTANTLSGSRTYNEVQNRYLSMSSGAAETEISLARANDTANTVHSSATLNDSPSNAEKIWTFQTSTSSPYLGLELSYEELTLSPNTALSLLNFTWAQTPTSLNPYIGTTVTKLNPSATYEADKQTVQTLDQYGNVLTQQIYNFGAPGGGVGSLARTYTNTYLGGSAYTSLYIVNRLLTSTVTDGTNTATLASNSYDQNALTSITATCGGTPSLCEHDNTNYPASFTTRGDLSTSTTLTNTTANHYDMTGNVTSSTVNGVTSSVTPANNYAAPGQITTNALTSTMNWSGFLGLSSATGPNGDTGSIGYDANARPSSTLSPYGAGTTYTYNDTASPPNKFAMTNAHGSKTVMDGFGRTIQTVTGSGTSSSITTVVSTVDTQYAPCGCSPLGKLYRQSQPYAPGGSDAWTTYTYDASGRTLTAVLPDNSTTTYSYEGNWVGVTDPAGKSKSYEMDAFGNLVQVAETDPSLGVVYTAYAYDVLKHLTNVWMSRGSTEQARAFNYNSGTTVTGFLQSATNPENGTVSYTYNTGTNTLASKTDAKNQKLTYQYDTYNRLTSVTWANNPHGADVLRTYYYDTNPLQTGFSQNSQGRLTAVQYPDPLNRFPSADPLQFVDMYSYVAPGTAGAGLPATKRLQVNENYNYMSGVYEYGTTETGNLDTTFTYNDEGKITAMTYPSTVSGSTTTPGPSYNYSYDSIYRLSGMTTSSGTAVVSNVTYNAANQMLTGIDTRSYNTLGQLTGLNNGSQNLTYTYPTGTNNGKISSMYNAISGETITYTYDSLNRLSTASDSIEGTLQWTEGYGFDSFGNLFSKNLTAGSGAPNASWVVNTATNQTGSVDANGNTLSSYYGTQEYSLGYDTENRVAGVANINGNPFSLSYAYDGQNRRIFSWNGSEDSLSNPINYTVNVYTPSGQKLAAYTLSPSLNTCGSSPCMEVALASSDQYFGGRRVAAMDQLGSAESPHQSYFPWGEPKGTSNPQDTWNFATYWTDSATGLDYANNRYYSNIGGQFMTPDPSSHSDAGNPQSWNQYAYALGDPVNRNDPTGLFTEGGGDGNDAGGNDGGDDPDPQNPKPNQPTQGGGGGGGGFGLNAWNKLSANCQNGLKTKFGPKASIDSMLSALYRANADESVFQNATAGTNITWGMLAAIAIRETGVTNMTENDGAGIGVGVFQISVPGSGLTAAQAGNLATAAGYSAQLLNSNMAYLSKTFGYTGQALLQATAASFNMNPYKPGNFTGNPSTIDGGTANGNYGSNVLQLMDCFH